MNNIGDTQIVRTYFGIGQTEEDEFEIPIAYKVEELYKGSEEPDDPSHCIVNQRVKVLEDVGPFRVGDFLVLTDLQRKDLEDEVLQAYWKY